MHYRSPLQSLRAVQGATRKSFGQAQNGFWANLRVWSPELKEGVVPELKIVALKALMSLYLWVPANVPGCGFLVLLQDLTQRTLNNSQSANGDARVPPSQPFIPNRHGLGTPQ
jgi:hypothetical protein